MSELGGMREAGQNDALEYYLRTAQSGNDYAWMRIYNILWDKEKSKENTLDKDGFSYFMKYLYEQNINRNYISALTWLRKSVERNYSPAICELSLLYIDGSEQMKIESNLTKAKELAQLAAKDNYAVAMNNLAIINEKTGNKKMSVFWYGKAADAGLPFSQFTLANIYAYGLSGFSKNNEMARRYYELAGEKGI